MVKKLITVAIVAGLLALFAATLWYLWRKSQTHTVVYKTESPAVADIVKKTVATGSVIPRKEVAVKPQVSGIIDTIRVEAGQTVRRGDLLATIRVIPNAASLAAAESRVKQARLRAEDAERELERKRRLYKEGIVPETDFQQASLARDTSVEELAAAEDGLEVVRRGVTARSGDSSNTIVNAVATRVSGYSV